MELSLESLLGANFDVKFWSSQVGRRVRRESPASIDHGYITGVDWSRIAAVLTAGVSPSVAEEQAAASAEVYLQFVTGESELVDAGSAGVRLFVYEDFMGTRVNERNCVGKFDFVVLGGGPAGLSAAQELAKSRPEQSVCVLEWKKVFGGRPGQRLVGKTRSPYYLDKKQAGHEFLRSKFSGYATCSQQPVDWVEMFWIRELFFWSVVGAIFCPTPNAGGFSAAHSFRGTLEKIFVSWLDLMGAEAGGELEDQEFVSQFQLPDERNQILSISETLVSEVFPVEEVGSRDVAKRKFLTPELLARGLFDSPTANDMWRVVGEAAGVHGPVLKRLFRKFLGCKAIESEIRAAVVGEFGVKTEDAEWVNLRTSEEEAEDAAKMETVIARLLELATFECVDEASEIDDSPAFVLEDTFSDLNLNPHVALISESIVGGLEIVHAAGGNFSQGQEELEEVVRVWFKRRNCLRYLLARGVVVALPFTTLTSTFQVYDTSKDSSLVRKIRTFAQTFAVGSDCKHFVFRIDKMCERPIPVEWRIPGLSQPTNGKSRIGEIRSWRELFDCGQGAITWTATNARFRVVEVVDEDEEDCDWLVHCELPSFVATPNAKRDCRNFLQALIPGLKLSDGTLLELDNFPGRICPTDEFDSEIHRALCAEISDQRVAVAGEFATPVLGLLGTVAGAAASGRSQAAALADALKGLKPEPVASAPEAAAAAEAKRAVLSNTTQAVGGHSIGRVGGASEERRSRRDDATLVGSAGGLASGAGGSLSKRTGKGEVDIPGHLLTTALMRNISVLSDGWKYRKETRDFKVYFPKRTKLSLVLRDKQLIMALMQRFPDDLRRLNGFNELVRSRPEYSEGDPYPLALDFFGVDSVDLPSIEDLAFEGDAAGAAEAQVAAEWSEDPSEGEEDEAADALLTAQAGASLKKSETQPEKFRVNFAYGRYLYLLPWRDSVRDAARDWWVVRTVIDALAAPNDKRNFINSYRNMATRRIHVPAVLDAANKRRVRKFIDAQIKKYGSTTSEDVEMSGTPPEEEDEE